MVGTYKCIVCTTEKSSQEAVLSHIKSKHPDWLATDLYKNYVKLVEKGAEDKLSKITDQSSAIKETKTQSDSGKEEADKEEQPSKDSSEEADSAESSGTQEVKEDADKAPEGESVDAKPKTKTTRNRRK